MPITRTILATAAEHPDRPAIVGESSSLTYRELIDDNRRVMAAVRHLQKHAPNLPAPAPEAGAPVTAVSSTSAFDAARIMAGLAGYHQVSATIDPRWPDEHKQHVIRAAGISVVIVDDQDSATSLRSLLGKDWGGAIVPLDEFRTLERRLEPAEPPTVRAGDEPYLMLFSSGTTSNPKAFLKTRHQYRANFKVSSSYLEPFPGVATLAPGPFAYSLTLYAAVESLASGGQVHLADTFSLPNLAQRIARENITRIVTVPAVVRGIIAQATRTPELFAGLELIVAGGANLPDSLRHDLADALPHVRLLSYYGAAEIGFIGDVRGEDSTWNQIYDGVHVEIRDDAGRVVPDGEIGTVWVLAASRSDDYIAGTAHEHLLDANGWATVHDQGRMETRDGARQLQVVGRKGDIINTGGHKVALPEVTRAYAGLTVNGTHAEAVAVGLPDPVLGQIVALAVEIPSDELPDKVTLRAHGQERLAPQFVPSQYYKVSTLPRTVGGKVRTVETSELLQSESEGVVRL